MNTPSTPADPPSLEDRVSALEAENRELQRSEALLRWVLLPFLTAVPAYCLWQVWFGTLHAPTVDTKPVIVRDPAGFARTGPRAGSGPVTR
jgi:hypothetical protein